MTSPIRRLTRLVSVLRAENPGPMTLEGTNSLLLHAPGSDGVVVVDPGPDLPEHVQALAAAGPVELVLITHRHNDHTEAIDSLRELTAAPVRAALPEHCRHGQPLRDGERLTAAGVSIEVLATPGHSPGSVCLHAPDLGEQDDDGTPTGVLFSGDTLFQGGPGATGRSYSDFDTIIESIRERLLTLPESTVVHTGHGGSTRIGDEKPHLQEWIERGH
ncbi:MAG: MBL fold metallo-hydrolase [Micrococcales bacterium]|nr:MBL fold metallo-hydrolase [Micrococcales bacterium]